MKIQRFFSTLLDLLLGDETVHHPESVDTRYIAMKVRAAEDLRYITTRK